MKTILVTGASRGIGNALAKKFLENGDVVFGTSTNGDAHFSHKRLKMFRLDLGDPVSIKRCADDIAKLGKKIDILINNAGIVIEEEADSPAIVTDFLRKTLEVNLIGTVNFTERIIPLINEGGQIINLSSSAGSLGHTGYTSNYPSYRISKASLNMLTRILARRLAGKVKVSSVHPGWVQTDMGGEGADISPAEAAQDIFMLANSDVETGQFWFKQKKFPW
ncbi:MAG: hypothetical protein A2942_04025 [Candidatus Lloydbacteria bacterium RIFCSPLOWO2_01_FULL_50_20]|uniref:Short-chain dehydrogenase n=1 Tax=Candidatus Lloydbacteria bacterium RIFCSPLOWO2_01_FULL_50_20 TaxID=1798665 RepID=A0A1G2DCW4_9BACT|nr:MAG: hypothetical protein A3C13_00230 [Candidatus Lloydbacteria bacterium RIFCSPHIGHO2_02_FULL_50_11]OGZ11353.1 MAG: hypothetical protein A2942_04025 [Candidatus Lloydbacteria bacterium RIFCSPLOWO2_01_FULL_50_20]